MLREDRTTVEAASPADRVAAYRQWCREAGVGTGIDGTTSLGVVSRRWVTEIDEPVAAETVAAEAREVLLVAMARTTIDVDTLLETLEGTGSATLTAQAVRTKLTGEQTLTLEEYATIEHAIARYRAGR